MQVLWTQEQALRKSQISPPMILKNAFQNRRLFITRPSEAEVKKSISIRLFIFKLIFQNLLLADIANIYKIRIE